MQLEVTRRGAALRIEDSVHPLKHLVAADRLGLGTVRLVGAERTGAGGLLLRLSDGTQHRVGLPDADHQGEDAPDLLVRGIGQLLTMSGDGIGAVADAAVACRDGRVLAAGPQQEVERRFPPHSTTRILEAEGGLVTPGLVEPHSHPVFGVGQRHIEFGLKAQGRSYMEIHKAGGGILATVRATREASFDQLAQTCTTNLTHLLRWGVTTAEGKSGYALETDGELRMLEVMQVVGSCHPVDVVPTLLGAHTLPGEYATDRAAYVGLVAEEMVPRAAAAGLAEYCDAYCEDGAFTPQEVEQIFTAARAHGMGLRLHAEQFTDQGGAALAAMLGAVSADHLEAVSEAGIQAMARASTVAVLLPGAALTCRCPWPPARALIDAGVPVALGTDLNPGSSMTASLPLMMSLACMQMQLSCEEAWRAVTVVPARSLGRQDIGQLIPGSRADLVIFDAPDYRYVPYHYGENHARRVVKDGRVVVGE